MNAELWLGHLRQPPPFKDLVWSQTRSVIILMKLADNRTRVLFFRQPVFPGCGREMPNCSRRCLLWLLCGTGSILSSFLNTETRSQGSLMTYQGRMDCNDGAKTPGQTIWLPHLERTRTGQEGPGLTTSGKGVPGTAGAAEGGVKH